MKPRTKLQIEVFRLSTRLSNLAPIQKEWAYKECLDHVGYATKTRVICMDCGETFAPELVKRKRATCPHCNTKLTIEASRKRTYNQTSYFALAEVYGEYQIIRNYELHAYHKMGENVRYHLHEILQYWIDPKGKTEMVGLLHMTSGYSDCWTEEWGIRKNGYGYYSWNENKYKVYPDRYHPDSEFKKEYAKMGINKHLDGLYMLDAIRIIPENPKAETLLKAKQYSLLNQFTKNNSIGYWWPTIKICLRNRYKVKDATMWFDYLDLLRYFNKDLRNAHYVCPKNLKKEHDRLVAKKRAIQKRKKLEEQRVKALKDQKVYSKQKGIYFGLEFTDKNITLKVLSSIQEFMEEGDHHKHCLFTNEYYNKKDSLCFSALVNGERMETVEISISQLKVLQSRGYKNKATEHHDAIVAAMEKHMRFIKAISKPKKKQSVTPLSNAPELQHCA